MARNYFYLGEAWNVLDFNGSAFDAAHFLNNNGTIELKVGSITNADIATNAAIAMNKITGLQEALNAKQGNVVFDPGSFVVDSTTTPGTTAVDIKPLSITNAEIADTASIAQSKIQDLKSDLALKQNNLTFDSDYFTNTANVVDLKDVSIDDTKVKEITIPKVKDLQTTLDKKANMVKPTKDKNIALLDLTTGDLVDSGIGTNELGGKPTENITIASQADWNTFVSKLPNNTYRFYLLVISAYLNITQENWRLLTVNPCYIMLTNNASLSFTATGDFIFSQGQNLTISGTSYTPGTGGLFTVTEALSFIGVTGYIQLGIGTGTIALNKVKIFTQRPMRCTNYTQFYNVCIEETSGSPILLVSDGSYLSIQSCYRKLNGSITTNTAFDATNKGIISCKDSIGFGTPASPVTVQTMPFVIATLTLDNGETSLADVVLKQRYGMYRSLSNQLASFTDLPIDAAPANPMVIELMATTTSACLVRITENSTNKSWQRSWQNGWIGHWQLLSTNVVQELTISSYNVWQKLTTNSMGCIAPKTQLNITNDITVNASAWSNVMNSISVGHINISPNVTLYINNDTSNNVISLCGTKGGTFYIRGSTPTTSAISIVPLGSINNTDTKVVLNNGTVTHISYLTFHMGLAKFCNYDKCNIDHTTFGLAPGATAKFFVVGEGGTTVLSSGCSITGNSTPWGKHNVLVDNYQGVFIRNDTVAGVPDWSTKQCHLDLYTQHTATMGIDAENSAYNLDTAAGNEQCVAFIAPLGYVYKRTWYSNDPNNNIFPYSYADIAPDGQPVAQLLCALWINTDMAQSAGGGMLEVYISNNDGTITYVNASDYPGKYTYQGILTLWYIKD